ncbi:hypothetical protein KEM60_00829 [Austwickia sp. TVS 96-490-7B]|nr:hypothetical protein [Austwickia sp. TVS 96-490-7B]
MILGVVVQQAPVGSIDYLLPGLAMWCGVGRVMLSLGHVCICLGAALIGAGIVIRHLADQSPHSKHALYDN